jgi:hypothetical protein
MTIARRLLLSASLVTLIACAPHNPVSPSSPVHPTTVSMTALPHSPDIAHEVMGYLVVSDGARLAQQLTPDQPNADPKQLSVGLLTQMGISPDLAATIDLSRPLGVALLNPGLLATGSVQPYVAMVPVSSRKSVEDVMAAHNTPFTRTAWGFQTPTGKAQMSVAFVPGYAVVAWREDLLAATVNLLAPRLAKKADAPVVVHLDFDNVHEAFGPQIEQMMNNVAQLAGQGGAAGDPQVAYALRGVRMAAQYMRSVSDLELLANIDSGGVTLTLRADAKDDGAFAGYVKQQRPGPAWGVQFLPRDSVLAYATHESPVGRAADVSASVAYVTDAGTLPAGVSEREKVRKAFERAALTTDGELAYAVWPGRAGGVGLGGAYRVNNPVEARAAAAGVYEAMSPRLGRAGARRRGARTSRQDRAPHGALRRDRGRPHRSRGQLAEERGRRAPSVRVAVRQEADAGDGFRRRSGALRRRRRLSAAAGGDDRHRARCAGGVAQ